MRRGPRAAAEHAYAEAYPELFLAASRVARRIVADHATAEDIAAETLARTYCHWHAVADLAYRDAWVLRVATNLALDRMRRRTPALLAPPASGFDETIADRISIIDALRRLPRRQRDVVAMTYFAGMTPVEVGEQLGISVNSVRTHARRALVRLRRDFGPVELEVA